MKKVVILLLCAVFLTGCSSTGKTYIHVMPHSERTSGISTQEAPAQSYADVREILQSMVENGLETGVINAVQMEQGELAVILDRAVQYVQEESAIGAYAVEEVHYDVGTAGGKMAAAVTISYRRSAMDLKRILRTSTMEQVQQAIEEALKDCRPNMTIFVSYYTDLDVQQLVQDLARQNPDTIMETPETIETVYGSRTSRVMELSFIYENSRDSLRQMQNQVRPVFQAASLYVSGEGADYQKFSQLYAFLMERFDYTLETSITPTYSLLRHGVGDSRAFATVYAAMCSKAGLECQVVTGTHNGEPWTWNIVKDEDRYCHVDLLRGNAYREMTDSEMAGYVWDYSAFPECG